MHEQAGRAHWRAATALVCCKPARWCRARSSPLTLAVNHSCGTLGVSAAGCGTILPSVMRLCRDCKASSPERATSLTAHSMLLDG